MRVPASEFAKNFGRYKDTARDEVIEVTSHDRTAGYFVCSSDFEEFLKFKAHSRKILTTGKLTDEVTALIRASKMSDKHDHLNALMDD